MAPKRSKQGVKKKPAIRKPVKPLKRPSGAQGGGNKERAAKRYQNRLARKLLRESQTQWDADDQLQAERQLQKWSLMQKADALMKQQADSLFSSSK